MELNGNIVNARELGGALNRRSSLSGTIRRSSGGGSSDVFWATYGTTTLPELETAYQAGKIILLEYQNSIYYLEYRTSTMYVFHCMINGQTSGVGITLKEILYTSTYNTWAYYEYDALAANQYAQNAGKYLAVDNSGNVIPKAAPMAVIPSGAVDSTSTSLAFTATVSGIASLQDGVCVYLKNGVATSELGATLDVNGLGAKPIYISQGIAVEMGTQWNSAYSALFIYNSTRFTGGCWDFFYGYDSNTTYTPVKLGFGYATCDTAAATSAKTASLSSYTLTTGGIVSVKFTNAVGAGATLNINSNGAKAIYHKGAAITAGVIEAGDTATFIYSTRYHLIALDKAGGGSITVDSVLSDSSTNPVQNKVVKAGLDELDEKIDALNDSRTYAIPFSIGATGKYINYSTGEAGSGTNYDYTDYVDVSMCSSVIYRRAKTTVASTSVGLAFYDSTKTFIQNSGEQIEGGQAAVGYAGLKQIDVPSSAVYVRFSTLHDITTYGDFELYGLYKTPVVDSALSSTSKNPVQNKVVKEAIDDAVNVYWATYGTTTLAELQAAWADGKTILIYYQGNVYYLSSVTGNNNSSFVFHCPSWSTNGRAQLYEVMNSYGTWSYSAYEGSDYILAPSSPATGAFLVWNGSAWTAQTLSTWSGGSY